MARKRWRYGVGKRPYRVTVYERDDLPGGPLYVRVWDPTLRGGRGNWRKRSLGHRRSFVACGVPRIAETAGRV